MAPIVAVPAQQEGERITRLEERMEVVTGLLAEIRTEQRLITDTLARASGGVRMLMILGAIAAAWGIVRGVSGVITEWALR